ncbi:MAG: hypothetical protein HYV36_06010, partial [Lentisphaerae bacterium]|nr:hypothetical protein [Lentisphaerota bacterium]
MKRRTLLFCFLALGCSGVALRGESRTNAAPDINPVPIAALPLQRTHYIIGESLPVALRGAPAP